MSSQIANKIKINLCLISIKFFIDRTIPCATFNLKNMSSQIANNLKINLCFNIISIKFFIDRTILCATFNDLTYTTTIYFNCYYFLYSSAYTITIVHQIFITEIFKPQLFFLHATYLYTRLTEFFLNFFAYSVLPFISQTKQSCT